MRAGGRGYAHHIIRLMVLGNYALQRGWDPAELTGWFQANFVDGYDLRQVVAQEKDRGSQAP